MARFSGDGSITRRSSAAVRDLRPFHAKPLWRAATSLLTSARREGIAHGGCATDVPDVNEGYYASAEAGLELTSSASGTRVRFSRSGLHALARPIVGLVKHTNRAHWRELKRHSKANPMALTEAAKPPTTLNDVPNNVPVSVELARSTSATRI